MASPDLKVDNDEHGVFANDELSGLDSALSAHESAYQSLPDAKTKMCFEHIPAFPQLAQPSAFSQVTQPDEEQLAFAERLLPPSPPSHCSTLCFGQEPSSKFEFKRCVNAIWTLASLLLPSPLSEAPSDYEMIHIEAYIVSINSKVTFKLTGKTIDTLIEYYKSIRPFEGQQPECHELHEDFIQAIKKLVFLADLSVLEGLDVDGTGELLDGRSEQVKNFIVGLLYFRYFRGDGWWGWDNEH
ncbi:hypothetical protein N657DRAFT_649718 [Parathielavia appendiculata]|uniref:Uncharacterized protein n=1 Tax=Parathielavia appendiculata TaxID=2587402 RepID=A0AAN6TSK4_9PEZI|nr:hypothetical protein N657DRAFT_649718 [Parathielavia appendiculata]